MLRRGFDGGRLLPRFVRALLSVPLATKIIGANGLIVMIASLVTLGMHDITGAGREVVGVMVVALVTSLMVNLLLVHVALKPLRDLETTAGRVWRGDLKARVQPSPLADADMARVGGTINILLDGLTADRARMRRLAAQVIKAQDQERARIARELHDSSAQALTALVLQLAAAARDCEDPVVSARLLEIKAMAGVVLDEVRDLSHTVHPRVLDDLGLVAAVGWLARQAEESGGVEVEVHASGDASRLPETTAAALYRVAQEAMANAVKHANPTSIRVTIRVTEEGAMLEVADDGIGFDVDEAETRRPGMGLFSMEERVALVNGQLDVVSAPHNGTRVIASIPLVPLRES